MGGVQSDDQFNRARAELFEALGHPTRIRLLEAMKENPMSFSDLKKATGIESSGHLTFHIEKLNGLVKVAPDGRYVLTDDGKEAVRLVGRKALTWGGLPLRFFLKWLSFVILASAVIAVAVYAVLFEAGVGNLTFVEGLALTYVEITPPLAVFLWKTNQWRKSHPTPAGFEG